MVCYVCPDGQFLHSGCPHVGFRFVSVPLPPTNYGGLAKALFFKNKLSGSMPLGGKGAVESRTGQMVSGPPAPASHEQEHRLQLVLFSRACT